MTKREYTSFAEFWPFYVAEHSHTGTRLLHLFGTVAALFCLGWFIASGRWWLFPLALIPGYGAAWIGHFAIEKNRPATFQYPLWSFMGDYKMIAYMLTGKMKREVERVKEDRQRVRSPSTMKDKLVYCYVKHKNHDHERSAIKCQDSESSSGR